MQCEAMENHLLDLSYIFLSKQHEKLALFKVLGKVCEKFVCVVHVEQIVLLYERFGSQHCALSPLMT